MSDRSDGHAKSFYLPYSAESHLAHAIRKAIGAGDWDYVRVHTPQFVREDGKEITYFPHTAGEFESLRKAPPDILKHVGMRLWSKESDLWLFPGEWYEHIPEGLEIVNIFGETKQFKPGVTDDDIRFGCLAYGFVRIGDEGQPKPSSSSSNEREDRHE